MNNGINVKQRKKAVRSAFVRFKEDPFKVGPEEALEFFSDGLIVTENGYIVACGDYRALKDSGVVDEDTKIDTYRDSLVVPGFIDSHCHYVQTDVVASYGEQLIEWLNKYTFPAEMKMAEEEYARETANFYLYSCIKNGTTTPVAFSTSYACSADEFFAAAKKVGMRVITGNVFMDRFVPEGLSIKTEQAVKDANYLMKKWHNEGRASYSLICRFAPTSTPEQMEAIGHLFRENPDIYFHTHMSENLNEVAWVKELFPDRKDYLDVYDHYGLLGEKSIFAHSIHLSEREISRMSESRSIIAHSPSSNMFLGSGLLNVKKMVDAGVKVNMASDFAGGNHVSMLYTMDAAYKVAQLSGFSMHPAYAFYMSTTGAARNLGLADKIGNIEPGLEADFVVLNKRATGHIARRIRESSNISDMLFVFMAVGDERAIQSVYIAGKRVYIDGSLQLN